MMEYALIALAALLISGLTLFSGFGLGTVLMPVFALFFPVPTAIAATAVVHLANNIFKLGLIGRQADWRVVARFSLPAAVAAIFGASALVIFAALPAIGDYALAGRTFVVTPVKLIIGVLIVAFSALEMSRSMDTLVMPPKYLPLGGLLSGFFGGLSGNQGAFRSAFLIRSGLGKEAFVATGVVSAIIVDTVRLSIYGVSYFTTSFQALSKEIIGLVIAAMSAAFLGAFIGTRLLKRVTIRGLQIAVAVCMFAVGTGLCAGLI